MSEMQMVTLRNGATADVGLVAVTKIALEYLVELGIPGLLLVYDLCQIYAGKGQKVSPSQIAQLVDRNLLDADGQPISGLQDIISSSFKGDGFETTLVDPVVR